MGFVASEYAAVLDWDFGNGVKGRVPEPSQSAVNRFEVRMREAALKGDPELPREKLWNLNSIGDKLAQFTAEQLDAVDEEMLDAVAEICAGSPSREQLAAAGHRMFRAFSGWLTGELRTPEGSRTATNA